MSFFVDVSQKQNHRILTSFSMKKRAQNYFCARCPMAGYYFFIVIIFLIS